MQIIELNGKKFNVEFAGKNNGTIDNESFDLDLLNTNNDGFHVLKNNKSYNISVKNIDRTEKTITLLVNNNSYNIKVKDELDELLQSLGIDKVAKKVVKEIKAPMPGLVIDILVKVGDSVEEGENLLVLEAMKMENNLKSPVTGIIKDIKAKKGNSVEKNEILITFE